MGQLGAFEAPWVETSIAAGVILGIRLNGLHDRRNLFRCVARTFGKPLHFFSDTGKSTSGLAAAAA